MTTGASSTSKIHVIRRTGITQATADRIRRRLEHARVAGLLLSYDNAFLYDASDEEITVMFSPAHMPAAQQANFGTERLIADLLVERAITLVGPTE